MVNNTNYTDETLIIVKDLYLSGHSSHEIKDTLKLPVTARSVQRWIKQMGITRSVGDSFRLAVKKGRVPWHFKKIKKHRTKLNPKLRYQVLKRDGFTCVLCGRRSPRCILEVDHVNNQPDDNRIDNLRVLCHDCNRGRYLAEG
jgi:hypothetical protein